MTYPIVLLVIATFLFLMGVVGRGTSVGLWKLTLTLQGDIGHIPRVVFVMAAAICFIVSIALGVPQLQNSPNTSPSPPAESQSESPPSSDDSQASQIELKIADYLTPSEGEEKAIVSVDDGNRITLDVTQSNNPSSDYIYLSGTEEGTVQNYSVIMEITGVDGITHECKGDGEINVTNDSTYNVVCEPSAQGPEAVLQPAQ